MADSTKRWDEDHPYYVDELSKYFHTFIQARDALINSMRKWDSLKKDNYAFAYIHKRTKTTPLKHYAKIHAFREGNVINFRIYYGSSKIKSMTITFFILP